MSNNTTTAIYPGFDIGISDADRLELTEGLSKLLADTFTLYLMTHNFYWNVSGSMFNSLQRMFLAQYNELWDAINPTADRIRALGHWVPVNFSQIESLTSFMDAPAEPPQAADMLRMLVQAHETLARNTRELVIVAKRTRDLVTADLVTHRLEVHEKSAWMLRSLLDR